MYSDIPRLLRVAEGKQEIIKNARLKKGLTVTEENDLPLRKASKCFLKRYCERNNWGDNDIRWLQHLHELFRIGQYSYYENIAEIKEHLRSLNGSIINGIKELIEQGDIFATDISYGTWQRFNSQTKRENSHSSSFIAYCDLLEIDWQEIREDPASFIYSNLVDKDINFLARGTKLIELLRLISQDEISIISVESCAFFSKTTLVKEAAFCYLQAIEIDSYKLKLKIFNAFIFTSAKPQKLTRAGLLTCEDRVSTREAICKKIACTLKISQQIIDNLDSDNLLKTIIRKLKKQKISTLLVIDNWETCENEQDIISLIKELIKELSSQVKVLITSRKKTNLGVPFILGVLSEAEAHDFIKYQAQKIGVSITPKGYKQIYDTTGGVPGAIVYALNQFRIDGCLPTALGKLIEPGGEVAEFLYADSLQSLTQTAYYLLMALAMFPKPAAKEAIAYIVSSDNLLLEKDLKLLEDFLLIKYENNNRYVITSPLTRNYLLNKLKNNNPELREKWIDWYLQLSQKYGKNNHKDWEEYISCLDAESDNLKSVIEWCMRENKYSEILNFWRNIRPPAYHQGASITSSFNRLFWTDWLIAEAENRPYPDFSTLAEVSYDKAWILTLMEKFDEAKKLFIKACKLRHHHHQGLSFRVTLIIDIAYFYWKQKKYVKAFSWLQLSEKILNKSTHLDLEFIQRQWVKIRNVESRYKTLHIQV
ncbi:hypothetical protein [Nodularia chucula]|uniref:hypothetical protein n=1 Tax=Nodularia chucula TaxID=3093667 RepID=UPI0039C60094